MKDHETWTPSFAWHAKVVIACLVGCVALLLVGWQITKRLPAPYQMKRPSSQATVWKGN